MRRLTVQGSDCVFFIWVSSGPCIMPDTWQGPLLSLSRSPQRTATYSEKPARPCVTAHSTPRPPPLLSRLLFFSHTMLLLEQAKQAPTTVPGP